MKRVIAILLVVAAGGAGFYLWWNGSAKAEEPAAAEADSAGRRGGAGGFGGGGFGGFGGGPRLPMSVELGAVKRADMSEQMTVVGNLIGAATVESVPKVAGRLEAVSVRLGDRVSRGQQLAKIEDQELREQIRQ